MEMLVRLAARSLNVPQAFVAFMDREQLTIQSACGAALQSSVGKAMPVAQTLYRLHSLSVNPIVIEDTREHGSYVAFGEGNGAARDERAYLGVPLATADGELVGSLSVTDAQPRSWLPRDIELLRDISALIMRDVESTSVAGHTTRSAQRASLVVEAGVREDGERIADYGLQQQAMLVHLVHDPIYVWHPTRGVVFWNLGCENLYGYSKEEAAGRINHELLAIRFPESLQRYQEDLQREGRWAGELTITTRQRRRVVVSSRVQRINADGQTLYLQADRDITALRQTMERLAVSESRYQNLVTIAPVGVYEADPSGNYLYVNDRWIEIACVGAEQAVGQGWLNAVDSRDRDRVRQAWTEAVRSQRPFSAEFRFNCVGTGVNWVLSQSIPQVGTDGKLIGFMGTITDITSNKSVELDLRRSREQLRNFVGHMDSAIEEERRRIAREVHDQLGQALTAMKLDVNWSVQHLTIEAPAGQEATGRNLHHEPIVRKLRDLLALIDGTVDTVQRISAELRPQLLESMGLAAAVEVLAEQFEERTGIRCIVEAEGEFPLRPQDGMQVYRIIQESLTNVMRHAGASRVDIRLGIDDEEMSVSVQDNGRGIADAEKESPHAFGMVGMRERARVLGGNLTVSGAPKMGTVVQLALPLEAGSRAN